MRSSLLLILALAGAPSIAGAISATQCATAIGIPPGNIASATTLLGDPATMASVSNGLGLFSSLNGSACLLATGRASNPPPIPDIDNPPLGSALGDTIQFEWVVDVPPWASSFFVVSSFFTREYPEWVGSDYNDSLELWVSSGGSSSQVIFDSMGNPVTVNNALFTMTAGPIVASTYYDGGTGWVVSQVPVVAGSQITLTLGLQDTEDGLWDSGAVLDAFTWAPTPIPMPLTVHADGDGLPLDSDGFNLPLQLEVQTSPEIVPGNGGVPVELTGDWPADPVEVWIDDQLMDFTVGVDGAIQVTSVPKRRAAGPVDIVLVGFNWGAILEDALQYDGTPSETPEVPAGDDDDTLGQPLDDVGAESTSCSTGSGQASWAWLLLLVPALRRRRA